MKETIISICEKTFILQAISEGKRLDGRKPDEFRDLQINFGSDWGCCQVTLGETKVLAQASCEVQTPKPTRPSEGLLLLYVELSPMGAPHFEANRPSDLAVQLNRLLEKCIKDSRCVDLESLCITAEEKVWALRVDLNVLNHDGNLVDACSVAALTALAHFRHPDVTISGEQTVIHSIAERDPIPVSLHHHPVCITYAIFNKGSNVIADPTALEERVSEAQLVLSMNAYRELCGLHLGGSALATTGLVLGCAQRAAQRALTVVGAIKAALEKDRLARASEKEVGFTESMRLGGLLSLSRESLSVQLDSRGLREAAKNLVNRKRPANGTKMEFRDSPVEMDADENGEEEEEEEEEMIVPLGQGSAELIDEAQDDKSKLGAIMETGESDEESSSSSSGGVEVIDESSSSDSSEIQLVSEISIKEKQKAIDSIELSGDSEEEETTTLHAYELNETPRKNMKKEEEKSSNSNTTTRKWYSATQW